MFIPKMQVEVDKYDDAAIQKPYLNFTRCLGLNFDMSFAAGLGFARKDASGSGGINRGAKMSGTKLSETQL